MRGKVLKLDPKNTELRITPAYAGKSSTADTSRGANRDHPRLCGEKIVNVSSLVLVSGSPPPMRGKDLMTISRGTAKGITPAYAGKSSCECVRKYRLQDHPRLCGEKYRN